MKFALLLLNMFQFLLCTNELSSWCTCKCQQTVWVFCSCYFSSSQHNGMCEQGSHTPFGIEIGICLIIDSSRKFRKCAKGGDCSCTLAYKPTTTTITMPLQVGWFLDFLPHQQALFALISNVQCTASLHIISGKCHCVHCSLLCT